MIMFNLASTAPIGRGFSVNVLDHKMYGKGRSVDLTHNPAQRLCRHSSRLEGVLDCWLHSNGVLVSLEPGTLLLLGVEKVLQLAVQMMVTRFGDDKPLLTGVQVGLVDFSVVVQVHWSRWLTSETNAFLVTFDEIWVVR